MAHLESKTQKDKHYQALKTRLYDAYITSILTYNSCTWALTAADLAELEACRRRHLRRKIGVYCPRRVSNVDLYHDRARADHTKCEMAYV